MYEKLFALNFVFLYYVNKKLELLLILPKVKCAEDGNDIKFYE